MRRVAFFDRDGTINVNYGHVYRLEDLEFVDGIPEKIKEYNEKGIPVIVITNQAGIAKGYYTLEQMDKFNENMNIQLKKRYEAHIDAFYACPHHPDFTGVCDCRKPESGLFLQAAKEWDVDFRHSVMFGDKDSDRLAAEKVGIVDFRFISCKKNI